MSYILSLDQGTSSSRAIVFDSAGRKVFVCQQEFTQYFPHCGWVEHDPLEIWRSQRDVALQALEKLADIGGSPSAIGVTNQRETTVVWDAATGAPVYNAIVWQDRRTSDCCAELLPHEEMIRSRTGLLPDPYFSASKLKWILENVPGARERADRGELRFGTVDSWLVWNLTGGRVHVTDVSNASRTMLFNINTLDWDDELLALFDIPRPMLPEVVASSGIVGEAVLAEGMDPIPVAGILGDQQAALLGQLCLNPGSVKNTYGTGCFLLMNTGSRPVPSENRLLTTVAWKMGGEVTYALEGSIFVGGSAVQWLRDGLGIIRTSAEVEELAASVPDSGGVYFVPALTGLGAPHWDADARGLICGLSRGSTAAHIARATLEGIAYQTMDIVDAMSRDAGIPLCTVNVDGGCSRNDLLMQFQADVTGARVVRPVETESTALGAAYAAGLAVGVWPSLEAVAEEKEIDRTFVPQMDEGVRDSCVAGWRRALDRCKK